MGSHLQSMRHPSRRHRCGCTDLGPTCPEYASASRARIICQAQREVGSGRESGQPTEFSNGAQTISKRVLDRYQPVLYKGAEIA